MAGEDESLYVKWGTVHDDRTGFGGGMVELLQCAALGLGGLCLDGLRLPGGTLAERGPNISSQYGIIDTCGLPKNLFYYYQSWWTRKPVLHLFPHWNWPGMEGKKIAVWVHSNLERVELLVNGKSLGVKEVKKDSHVAWNVEYIAGAIEARGYKGDTVAVTARRETTGSPVRLVYARIGR